MASVQSFLIIKIFSN